jgi:hypothetical protein
MIEAAKPETLAPIMIASNSIMPLPSAEVDCRLFVIFATLVVERQSAGSLVCRFGALVVRNRCGVAPRLRGELRMLALEVAESSVGNYMVRSRRPPSQGWKTFLRNHAAGIASLDLLWSGRSPSSSTGW